MTKRTSKKEDLALIRATLQKDMSGGATADQAFAKVWEKHPDAVKRVTKRKPDA
ncbi:hypothetical protein [Sphingomonas echinoides]|uniref:hypothetical protein n=1 Tax=Sphingomonas echinoides TaxID=59803 RepID=UPI00241378B9|nr:hypothetical protein [Sphingomonas echinoides]